MLNDPVLMQVYKVDLAAFSSPKTAGPIHLVPQSWLGRQDGVSHPCAPRRNAFISCWRWDCQQSCLSLASVTCEVWFVYNSFLQYTKTIYIYNAICCNII